MLCAPLSDPDAVDDGHRMRIEFLRAQQQNVQAVVEMLVTRKRELIEGERQRAVARRHQAGVLAPHEAAIACWTLFAVGAFFLCRRTAS